VIEEAATAATRPILLAAFKTDLNHCSAGRSSCYARNLRSCLQARNHQNVEVGSSSVQYRRRHVVLNAGAGTHKRADVAVKSMRQSFLTTKSTMRHPSHGARLPGPRWEGVAPRRIASRLPWHFPRMLWSSKCIL